MSVAAVCRMLMHCSAANPSHAISCLDARERTTNFRLPKCLHFESKPVSLLSFQGKQVKPILNKFTFLLVSRPLGTLSVSNPFDFHCPSIKAAANNSSITVHSASRVISLPKHKLNMKFVS